MTARQQVVLVLVLYVIRPCLSTSAYVRLVRSDGFVMDKSLAGWWVVLFSSQDHAIDG